ncbi:PAS domain S-box protein [Ferruginibacter sp.]
MERMLKILMLEDSPQDAEIIQHFLLKKMPHCIFHLVMTRDAFVDALDNFAPDLILSDNTLPQFNATEALEIFNTRSLFIPFILVTGTVSEEFAAGIIKKGADDYILKDRLTRLPAAIEAALQKKRSESAIKQSEEVRKLIMNASLDAIVCIDTHTLITVWNPQAERMFGWKEQDVLGKELSRFIIPEQYRKAHSDGVNHFLKTGEGPVLNKVVELTALHQSGKEFPIELAVAHVKKNNTEFFCAFIRDITERKRSEESLKTMEERILAQKIQEQKKISRAIIKAQEEEKNYIGKELHDNINQILASTKMFLSSAAKKNEAVRDLIKYPLELIDTSIEEIRLLSHKQVTPLKNINLERLIRKMLGSFGQGGLPNVDFSYAVLNETLSDDLKLNIYRIMQEQMSNIVKHADARNVHISIKAAAQVISVVVMDDGKGFKTSVKRKGIGISNIMNRVEAYNGKVTIKSSPGKGCKISVVIPW